jgi:hypothetical protein
LPHFSLHSCKHLVSQSIRQELISGQACPKLFVVLVKEGDE